MESIERQLEILLPLDGSLCSMCNDCCTFVKNCSIAESEDAPKEIIKDDTLLPNRSIDLQEFPHVEVKKEETEPIESDDDCRNSDDEPNSEDISSFNHKDSVRENRDEATFLPTRKRIWKGPREKKHFCPTCSMKFNRPHLLREHVIEEHQQEKMAFSCHTCSKRFSCKRKLTLHEISHLPMREGLIYPCPHCDKKFNHKYKIPSHIRAMHSGDKPFVCEECGNSFKTKGALNAHQISHIDERPFQCENCSKKFKTQRALKKHDKDTHKETLHDCPHCELKLKSSRTLKMHLLVHSDVKNFKCNYCGSEFKRRKTLKDHLILHTGQRPYECPFCDKTFANGSNLISHKKKSHPIQLAAQEASGEQPRIVVLPRLEQLQPNTKMFEIWQSWCRLCAHRNSTERDAVYKKDSIRDHLDVINKYFVISLSPLEEESSICEECCGFLTKLHHFGDQCSKTDQMFKELIQQKNLSETELQSIRVKYGVDTEEIKYSTLLSCVETGEESKQENTSEPSESLDQPLNRLESDYSESVKEEALEIKAIAAPRKLDQRDEEDSDYVAEEAQMHSEDEDEVDEPKAKKQHRPKRPPKTKFNICEICSKVYSRRALLNVHIRDKHTEEGLPYACSQCPKRFVTEKKLKVHETIHLPEEEKYIHPCSFCGKKFRTVENLQAHVRAMHVRDKPYVCEECGKSFRKRGALTYHQMSHSDERSFQCSYCPKKFKNRPSLKRHLDIHNDQMYECPHCDLKLKTKITLRMHMLVHSDIKKYKCHYCGNEYKRAKTFKDHLFLHTGQRPYECPFCDKTFASGANCRSHKKKAHPAELAALEASGIQSTSRNIPTLEHLQSKNIPTGRYTKRIDI
uniref:C2h2-type zn-finger protein n=2 Tax=Lutzomyia longipalpis TaxID=7200 RepID=A0A1B0CRG7_LUTLO